MIMPRLPPAPRGNRTLSLLFTLPPIGDVTTDWQHVVSPTSGPCEWRVPEKIRGSPDRRVDREFRDPPKEWEARNGCEQWTGRPWGCRGPGLDDEHAGAACRSPCRHRVSWVVV